jgi:hypothetical protein
MTEQQLLVDALQRLNRADLAYMLTGSMASNYWGIPRTTHDLDFVIQLGPANIPKILAAFQRDYYLDEQAVRAAYQPPWQFNAIDSRSALKIDFWLLQGGGFEQEMFRRRIRVPVFGETAWIAAKEDVILHKIYWHQITPSDRQLGDAAGVVAVQRANLDIPYLTECAARINGSAILRQLLEGSIQPKTT